jgi:HSP20 family protein
MGGMNTLNFLTMKPMMRKTPVYGSYLPSFFDEIFNDFERPSAPKASMPRVNVRENEAAYMLEIAAPGMQREDFQVEIENDVLTVSGEVKKDRLDEGERYTRKEFTYQSFKRSFRLTEQAIDQEQIDAKYEQGILRIALPKIKAAASKTSKRIAIA